MVFELGILGYCFYEVNRSIFVVVLISFDWEIFRKREKFFLNFYFMELVFIIIKKF